MISGSGNVAQYACEKATQLGAKVVAMSDSKGFVYDQHGIDAEKLAWIIDLKNVRRRRIQLYAEEFGVEYYQGERPWGVKCDVALPCATQNELNAEEAKTLVSNGVMVVSEGANMPCTPEAVEIFEKNKVLFAPGKASNAGGVATSGLEMSQNALKLNWTAEEVEAKLHSIMKDIHATCVKYGTEGDYVNYSKGANIGGFIKVADTMLAQGLV